MSVHPSSLQLERTAAGDLRAEEDKAISEHVRECIECRVYLERLEQERHSLLERLPAEVFTLRVQQEAASRTSSLPRPLRFHLAWASLGVAAILGVLLILWRVPSEKTTSVEPETIRWRGGQVSVKAIAEFEGEHRLLAGDPPQSGERVRFEIVLPKSQTVYAAVFAEELGEVFAVLPAGNVSAIGLSQSGFLPGSVELDVTEGSAHVYVVVRTRSFSLEEVRRELQRAVVDRKKASVVHGVVYETEVLGRSP